MVQHRATGCFRKKVAPHNFFGDIFTAAKPFCTKFCKFVGISYSDISADFCRFILISHQMAVIFGQVLIVFTLSSFE